MMACFALYRLDERSFVFLPGNLAVFVGLAVGALSLALQRRLWLVAPLFGAGLTTLLGLISLSRMHSGLTWMRLPGSPVIWVVIGLYVAFRLALIYQKQQKQQSQRKEQDDAARHPPESEPASAPPPDRKEARPPEAV